MWKISRTLMQAFANSHSSQEAEGASSAGISSVGKQFVQSNGHPTRPAFFFNDKTTDTSLLSLFGTTFKPLTPDLGEAVLTWFREGFLARTSAQPGPALALPALARDFGVRWRGLSTKYSPDSCLWKTRPSLWDEGWTSSLPTLPRWGLMHDGALWERVTLTRLTSETESGSLPTPVAYDSTPGGPGNHYKGLGWRSKNDVASLVGDRKLTNGGMSLTANSDMVAVNTKRKKLPTPVANESDATRRFNVETSRKHFEEGTHQVHLSQMVRDPEIRKRVWPTPTVTQIKIPAGKVEDRMNARPGDAAVPLIERLQRDEFTRHKEKLPTPTSTNGLRNSSASEHHPGKWQHPGHPEYGELNPEWVEWLMGWAPGWTSLKPMPAENYHAWFDANAKDGGTQWDKDPTDDPDSGMKKTVPKAATKREEDIREARIAALGNGQVSAVVCAAFIHLWNLELPKDLKD